MELSLKQVKTAIHARVSPPASPGALEAVRVSGWSIDSRSIQAGDLFFAIKGDRFDGHAFVPDALNRGAKAAVVSETVTVPAGFLFEVADTVAALQEIAAWARRHWGRPIVAVTGSAGKTSTKDIIAELLSTRMRVGKTAGNLNNHIGLPLTLLRLPDDAEVGVVEIAMNHGGEIRQLARIGEPQIGVVTNVGYAHVEAFESIDGIAAAKRELIEALPQSGVAVLNADDERVAVFRTAHAGRTITFGFSDRADVRASEVELSASGAAFTVCGVRFHTSLAGSHSVLNILAGVAVAKLFDIQPRDLVETVTHLSPGKMRGERTFRRGITILDDSYNSNPEAARSMIDVLRREPAGRHIAVLGEMLELGHMAERLHRDLGSYVAKAGVDVLVGVRGASRLMVEEAKSAGMTHAAFFFEEPAEAGQFLREFARVGDAILFKGSRATHVEQALATMES